MHAVCVCNSICVSLCAQMYLWVCLWSCMCHWLLKLMAGVCACVMSICTVCVFIIPGYLCSLCHCMWEHARVPLYECVCVQRGCEISAQADCTAQRRAGCQWGLTWCGEMRRGQGEERGYACKPVLGLPSWNPHRHWTLGGEGRWLRIQL